MKFVAVTVASLVALASAAPEASPKKWVCKPGTYSCTTNPDTGGPGWQTCDTSGHWVYAGDCPPDTVCKFFEPSHSPYCVPSDFTIS